MSTGQSSSPRAFVSSVDEAIVQDPEGPPYGGDDEAVAWFGAFEGFTPNNYVFTPPLTAGAGRL